MKKIGDRLVDELGKLGDWVDDKSTSGALGRFFEDAYHDASDLWGITKDVFGIVSDLINVATGREQAKSGNALDSFKDTSDDVRSWMESDKGQKTISDTIDHLHDVATAAVTITVGIAKVIDYFAHLQRPGHEMHDDLNRVFGGIRDIIEGDFRTVESVVLTAFGKIIDGADDAFGWVPGLGGELDNARKQFDTFSSNVNSDIARIQNNKTITFQVITKGDTDLVNNGGTWSRVGSTVKFNRYGAVDHSFASGGIMPGIYNAVNGSSLVKFAEPETDGELYMPHKSADIVRQQALAGVAAGWADGVFFLPNRGGIATVAAGGGSGTLPPVHVHLHVDGKELGKGIVIDSRTLSAAVAQGNRQRVYTDVRQKAA